MTEFKVPELGENVATGDVTKVLVNVGDTIAREQPVLELETDKATIEVPSSVAGVVKEIRVKKGDKVKVGAVVLTVDAPSSSNGGGAAAAAQSAKPAPGPDPAACRRSPSPGRTAEGPADAGAALRLRSGQAGIRAHARTSGRSGAAGSRRRTRRARVAGRATSGA